jgi:hypothetical protein
MGGEVTSMAGYGGRGGIDGCLLGGEATSLVGYGGRGGIDGCLWEERSHPWLVKVEEEVLMVV